MKTFHDVVPQTPPKPPMWPWFPAVAYFNHKKQAGNADNTISPTDEIESIKTTSVEKESTGVLVKTVFETSRQGK